MPKYLAQFVLFQFVLLVKSTAKKFGKDWVKIDGGCGMIVRVYTGDDGQSHFEDLELPDKDLDPVSLNPAPQ